MDCEQIFSMKRDMKAPPLYKLVIAVTTTPGLLSRGKREYDCSTGGGTGDRRLSSQALFRQYPIVTRISVPRMIEPDGSFTVGLRSTNKAAQCWNSPATRALRLSPCSSR